jgi:hypothetical protein
LYRRDSVGEPEFHSVIAVEHLIVRVEMGSHFLQGIKVAGRFNKYSIREAWRPHALSLADKERAKLELQFLHLFAHAARHRPSARPGELAIFLATMGIPRGHQQIGSKHNILTFRRTCHAG